MWIRTKDQLPHPDKTVVVWYDKAVYKETGGLIPGIALGSYRSRLEEFRVEGSNYDCRNEIEFWMDIPHPDETEFRFYQIETTQNSFEFVGKHLKERERPNWHYYEAEDGDILHFRKEHMVSVIEKETCDVSIIQ